MSHYSYILSVDRLAIDAHIGFYEAERLKTQTIEVSFRLYFAESIASNHNDEAEFFDYGVLARVVNDCAASKQFNLIEFMGMELFRCLRAHLDTHNGAHAKLWLRLNKIQAPVPNLKGGASFIHSDLPPGATFIPTAL